MQNLMKTNRDQGRCEEWQTLNQREEKGEIRRDLILMILLSSKCQLIAASNTEAMTEINK